MKVEIKKLAKTMWLGLIFVAILFIYPKKNSPNWLLNAALISIIIWLFFNFLMFIAKVFASIFTRFRYLQIYFSQRSRFSYFTIYDIDRMSGEEFEAYTAFLLKKIGFHSVSITQHQGDQGIDILASRKKLRYGFQCKRWNENVGNKAIQETYSGQGFYQLDRAIVITNSYYTKSSLELANKLNIELWDRTNLMSYIDKYSR